MKLKPGYKKTEVGITSILSSAPTVRSNQTAHLVPAPTVRSKQAQGTALGDNPKMI